jgi:hypothetical protein
LVVLLAILFMSVKWTVLVPVFFAALILSPLSKATLSFSRSVHLEGDWAINIELGIIAFVIALMAAFFAWKMQSVPARRELYLNLLILTVGIPSAVALGFATLRFPS